MQLKARPHLLILIIMSLMQRSLSVIGSLEVPLDGICESVVPTHRLNEQKKLVYYEPPRRTSKMKLAFIGKGNFGKVYKGKLERKMIAVKVATKSNLNFREALNLHKLQKIPGIPELYGCEVGSENVYIYQQLLGIEMSNSDTLSAMQSKDFNEIIWLYCELALTLNKMHNKSILHRDIKPDNMMADTDQVDRIYLIDFGLSGPKQYGLKAGSPLYWSPNLFSKRFNVITEADDVWAMGLSMAEMLYGSKEVFSKEYETCILTSFVDKCQELVANKISVAFALRKEKYVEQCGQNAVTLFYDTLMNAIAYKESLRLSSFMLYNQLDKAKDECFTFIEKKFNIGVENQAENDPMYDLLNKSKQKVQELENSIVVDDSKIKVDVHKNVAIPGDDRAEPKLDLNVRRSIVDKNKDHRSKSAESGKGQETIDKKPEIDVDAVKNRDEISAQKLLLPRVKVNAAEITQNKFKDINPKILANNLDLAAKIEIQKNVVDPIESKPVGEPQRIFPKINNGNNYQPAENSSGLPTLRKIISDGKNPSNNVRIVVDKPFGEKTTASLTLSRKAYLDFQSFLKLVLLNHDLKTISKITDDGVDIITIYFEESRSMRDERLKNNALNQKRTQLNLDEAKPEIKEKLIELLGLNANNYKAGEEKQTTFDVNPQNKQENRPIKGYIPLRGNRDISRKAQNLQDVLAEPKNYPVNNYSGKHRGINPSGNEMEVQKDIFAFNRNVAPPKIENFIQEGDNKNHMINQPESNQGAGLRVNHDKPPKGITRLAPIMNRGFNDGVVKRGIVLI